MLIKLKRINENSKNYYQELESIKEKKKKNELKNTVTEMNTIIEGINSKLVDKQEPISDLEDRIVEITQSGKTNFRKMRTL